MPVGAIIGAGVATAGASVIASGNNSRAIDKSTAAQTAANDRGIAAQERARSENLGLQRPLYDAGMPALAARNALLGLGGTQPRQAANDAFSQFRDSTGYKFRFDQGMDALNSGWAGAGTLQSGAAMKSALEYGQGMGSAEFGNYWNMLGEQQTLAPGAANAMSGVNTTYANNAGALAAAQGNALSQSAVVRANNSNAMIGGIGQAFGNTVGVLAGRGYI